MSRPYRPTYRFQSRPTVTPPPGYTDTETLVLTTEGQWLANGLEISHERMRDLFFRSLYCDDAGYYLHIGREVKSVSVEGCAYFVVSLAGDAAAGFQILLSDGTVEPLDLAGLSLGSETSGHLLTTIKSGGERARFLRGPYHELLTSGREIGGRWELTSGAQKRTL